MLYHGVPTCYLSVKVCLWCVWVCARACACLFVWGCLFVWDCLFVRLYIGLSDCYFVCVCNYFFLFCLFVFLSLCHLTFSFKT